MRLISIICIIIVWQYHYNSGINNIYSDPYETYKRGLDGTEYKSVQSAQSDRKVKNKRDFNFNV